MAWFERPVGHEVGAHQILPFIGPLIGAAVGGIAGALGKPKMKDQGVYPMGKTERGTLAKDAYTQLHGLYETDPNTFWGQGVSDWAGRSQLGMPEGGLTFDDLMGFGGPGGGGGGGGFGGGGGASRGSASRANASLVDLGSDPYQLDVPSQILAQVIGKGRGILGTQTDKTNRELANRASLQGLSPAVVAYLQGQSRSTEANALGDLYGDFETSWYEGALGRQDSARQLNAQLETGVSQTNASLATQASLANAANATQASLARASMGAASAEAAAQRRADASRFALGLWDRNQDRDIDRYAQLNQMNMGWQQPVNQKAPTQSTFQSILGGAAGGLNLFSGLKSSGLFGGGGGGGGGAAGGGGDQMGNAYGPFPSGGRNYLPLTF